MISSDESGERRFGCGARALAIEYAKDGIRVNTVALGVIKTPPHKPETYEVRREGRVELRASLYLILPTDSPRGRP